jgi:EAL domain-containing protein (putative c-di-GMP-specific phosphodiesterase class I)
MAVNVSAIEFRDESFLDGLFAILRETGLDPKSLELELTESVLMKHAASTATILQTLRESGIRVAVDDFGTGYSSLSYLAKVSGRRRQNRPVVYPSDQHRRRRYRPL